MTMTPQMSTWIINHFFRQTTVTSPAGLFLALYTVQPAADGTGGTEVAGGSYARKSTVLGAPDTAGRAPNTAPLDFTNMPTCVVVAGGLFTAITGGTLMDHSRFSVVRSVTAGKTFTVPIGDVVLRFY